MTNWRAHATSNGQKSTQLRWLWPLGVSPGIPSLLIFQEIQEIWIFFYMEFKDISKIFIKPAVTKQSMSKGYSQPSRDRCVIVALDGHLFMV